MRRVKKGITILEIVIGLAIIGIMLVPLANGLLTSVKANKKGEETQQAKLIGQQAVEKLKVENKIADGEKISFHDKELEINSISVPTGSDKKYSIKSTDEINGYKLNGTITEENVLSINEDSYENSGIKEKIGLYINLDLNADGKIVFKYMEGGTKTLEELLLTNDSAGMNKIIIEKDLKLKIELTQSAQEAPIAEETPSEVVKITSTCNKVNKTINGRLNGVILIYINDIKVLNEAGVESPSVNIEVLNNSGRSEEVQILRDISVQKEDFEKGLKVDLSGNLNSYNNVIYDSTDSRKGLYTVELEVSKKDEKVESISSQFYLER
ncbi:MAG: type II secretion system protein [Sarcina sp.]